MMDDEGWVQCERPRQSDALPLSSTELVPVSRQHGQFQADERTQLRHPDTPLQPSADPVDDQRLLDDVTGAQARIERVVRVLKHDLHIASSLAQFRGRQGQHVLPAKADLTRGGFDEPQNAPSRRCLAATRLADEAEGFASFDREADTVDGANNRGLAPQPPSANEVLDEGADLEQWHGAVTLQHRVGVPVSCPGCVPGRTSSTSPGGRVRRQTARAGWSHRG